MLALKKALIAQRHFLQLLCFPDNLNTAHIRNKRLRNDNRTILLLIVLKDCCDRTAYSKA